jgi:CRP-like cAMP-binding protein
MSAIVATRRPEQNCLLAALPEYEYDRLAPQLNFVSLEAHQILALPDEQISRVYFLRGAVVSLLVPMEDGSAVEGATVGREGVIGLEAVLGEKTSRLETVVQIPGEAVCLDVVGLRAALERGLVLHTIMRGYALSLLHQMARSAGCNLKHTVRERVARVLLMSYDAVGRSTFPLTHEVLAVMLGVRRASVTEAATSLHNAGLISYHRGSMTILDAERLKGEACVDYELNRAAHEGLRVSMWS